MKRTTRAYQAASTVKPTQESQNEEESDCDNGSAEENDPDNDSASENDTDQESSDNSDENEENDDENEEDNLWIDENSPDFPSNPPDIPRFTGPVFEPQSTTSK